MTSIDRDRIILAKTAWSDRYDSLGEGDDPIGEHDYLRTRAGSEAFNFKPAPDGLFYGHFHARGHLNLKRIENRETESQVANVTVIWVSKPPKGGLRVVGWYRDATLYDGLRKDGSPWSHVRYGDEKSREGKPSYICIAPTSKSVRLTVEERERWMIPKSVSRRTGRTDFLYPHVGGHLAPWVTEMDPIISRIESYRIETNP